MSALAVQVTAMALLWVAAAWASASRKALLPATVTVVAAAVGTAMYLGVVVPSDAGSLHVYTGLDGALMRLGLWALFGAAAAQAGWRESSRWAPVVFGLVAGELGGAVLAVQGVSDPSARARRVVAASAGALLSRVADPSVWLLIDGTPGLVTDGWGTVGLSTWVLLVGTAVVGAVVAFPPKVDGLETVRPPMVLGVGAMVWLASWMPLSQLPVVALATAVLWFDVRARVDAVPLFRVFAVGLVGLIAVAAGLAEQHASLLEAHLIEYEAEFPLLVWASGAVSGLVLGSDGGALAGRAVLDRALAIRDPMAPALWGLGAAVAGLGPHLVAGTLVRGLPRHLLWMAGSAGLVAVAWSMGWLSP